MTFFNKFQRVTKSGVRSLDLFKQPVTFYKDNEKKHSSFTAGLFSLGLLIFLLIMFIIVAVQIL